MDTQTRKIMAQINEKPAQNRWSRHDTRTSKTRTYNPVAAAIMTVVLSARSAASVAAGTGGGGG